MRLIHEGPMNDLRRLKDRVEKAALRSVELHDRNDIARSQVRRADRYLTKVKRTLADAVGDFGVVVHKARVDAFRAARLPYSDDG